MTDRKPLSLISGQVKSISSGDQILAGGLTASGNLSLLSGSAFVVEMTSGTEPTFQFGINAAISTITAVGSGGLLIDSANNDMTINVGGDLTFKNTNISLFSIGGDVNTPSLTGSGATSTLISASSHPLQLVGSRVEVLDGATNVLYIEDIAGISTIDCKGTAGGEVKASVAAQPLYLSAGSAGKVITRDGSTSIFENQLSGSVSYLTGMAANTVLRADLGNITIQSASASAVLINEGATACLRIEDIANVTTIAGQGTSAVNFTSPASSNLFLSYGTNGVIQFRELTTVQWQLGNSAGRTYISTSGLPGTIQSSTGTLRLIGTTNIEMQPTAGIIQYYKSSTLGATLTIDPASASSLQFVAGATSISFGQDQKGSSGVGCTWTIQAQRGNSNKGGTLALKGGDPGTSTTHEHGDIQLTLGVPVTGGNTAFASMMVSGSSYRDWYYSASITQWIERFNQPSHEVLIGGNLLTSSDGATLVMGRGSNGVGIGAAPISNQNRTLYIVDRVPSAAPTGGVFAGSNHQLTVWTAEGIREEASCQDLASGGTSKRIYDRIARLTSTTIAAQAIDLIAAADLPTGSPNWSGRAVVQYGGYDTITDDAVGGMRVASIKCLAGTITVLTSAANQIIGTDDDPGSTSIAGTGQKIQITSGKVQFLFTTGKTNNTRLWAHLQQLTLIEH